MARLKSHVWPIIAAGLMFLIGAQLYETYREWRDANTPPIEWGGVNVLTPEVRPGGTLRLEYLARIRRQCPADLRSFIVAADGSVPVRFPVLSGGYTEPTDGFVSVFVSVQVPRVADPGLMPLAPGRFVYRTVATRYCAHAIFADTGIPDAQFELLPPE